MGTISLVGSGEAGKLKRALDGFFLGTVVEGVQPFRSFRRAYQEITGDVQMHGTREHWTGLKRFRLSVTESLQTSDWGQILADSIGRAMLADYQTVTYLDDWRKIASQITPAMDFRTQRRMRIGGYGDLSTVAERGTYPSLTSPTDEEATYLISKKGGIEDITWEMTVNDDVGAVRRIAATLSRAAKRTLYKGVFDLLRTNAICSYDSVALAAAGHGPNVTTTALSQSSITTARRAMAEQKGYGDVEELNLFPKTLVVPAELEETAFRLTKLSVVATPGQAATETAFQRSAGPNQYLVVPYWTDPSDWWAVADPADIPTIEVGFLQGRQEPEVIVHDDPKSGSMFAAEKIQLKVRHVWGVCVLEHRGFYGGVGVA